MSTFKMAMKALGTTHKALGMLYRGTTIAQCKGVDEKLLEGIYALGYQYYQNKNFELASKIFRYICIHNHREAKYIAALGLCEFQKKEYESAQYILENAVELDPQQPTVWLALAKCLIIQKKPKDQILDVLTKLILLSENNELCRREHQEAQVLLSQHIEVE